LKTKEEKFLIRAEDFLSKLKNRFPSKTVFKSFLFYYGASIGEILYQNEKAKGIGLRGAESLIEMYNEESQVIPLGLEAEESHSVGESEVNVDSVIATVCPYTFISLILCSIMIEQGLSPQPQVGHGTRAQRHLAHIPAIPPFWAEPTSAWEVILNQ